MPRPGGLTGQMANVPPRSILGNQQIPQTGSKQQRRGWVTGLDTQGNLQRVGAQRHARHRNRTVWAHSLVLFNVYGIPLSFGPYFEYYYTTALPTKPIWSISLIIALQIFCIFAVPFPVGWIYQRLGDTRWWSGLFVYLVMVAFGTLLAIQWQKNYAMILILQGPVLGTVLGALWTISTLVLGSHYRNNLPLVSMQGGFVGLAGAVIHTIVAWQCFRQHREGHHTFAQSISAAIIFASLFTAYILMRRFKPNEAKPWTQKYQLNMRLPKDWGQILKEKGTAWFIPGYILIFFGLFTWPIYLILIRSCSPSRSWPDDGTHALLATLGVAALSASITAQRRFRRRLGTVNIFVLATAFVSVSSITHVWMSNYWIENGFAAAYGFTLGTVLALHNKATTVFHWGDEAWCSDMPARAAMMMAFGGLSAAGGLMVTALLLERLEQGEKIALFLSAAATMTGGLLVAVARWKRCGVFYVAI